MYSEKVRLKTIALLHSSMNDIKGLRVKRKREREESTESDSESFWEQVDMNEWDELAVNETVIICTNCGELNKFSDYCKNCISSLNPRYTFTKERIGENLKD